MPFDFSAYTVAPGEKPASSAKFNNFLNAVQAACNAMPPANLLGYPSDASKFLNGGGGWTTPITDLAAAYQKSSTTTVVNTTTNTDLFGGAITIAANKLKPGAAMKIWAGGDLRNNTGANQDIELTLSLGASVGWDSDNSDPFGSGGNDRAWWFSAVILGVTNTTQWGGGLFGTSDNNAAATGQGVIHPADGPGKFHAPFVTANMNANLTGSNALALKVALSAASANLQMRCFVVRVEVSA